MTANGWIQILFFFAAILLVTAPLGVFMHRVMEAATISCTSPWAGSSVSSTVSVG